MSKDFYMQGLVEETEIIDGEILQDGHGDTYIVPGEIAKHMTTAVSPSPSYTIPPIIPTLEDIFQRTNKPAMSTRKQYIRIIERAMVAGVDFGSLDTLSDSAIEYASSLKSSSLSFFCAAMSKYADELTHKANSHVTVGTLDVMTVLVMRLKALKSALRETTGENTTKGTRAHFWLSFSQQRSILDKIDTSKTKGKRDLVVFMLALGTGARRTELINLTWGSVKPQGDGCVLEITGKGNKTRVLPLDDRLCDILDGWKLFVEANMGETAVGDDAKIIKTTNKGGKLVGDMSGNTLLALCQEYGSMIGVPALAPHDLRRSFAQLGYEAGIPIGQLSLLLGHASIKTTQKYLNIELNTKVSVIHSCPFDNLSLGQEG